MLPGGFNWLDIIIGLILVAALIKGVSAGLIRSIFNFAGIIAGLVLAINYYAPGSSLILIYITLPQLIADALSFILIFSFTAAIIHAVGYFVAAITRVSLFRFLDKIGGGAAGIIIGLALIGVLLILMTAFPLYDDFPDHVEESYLAEPIIDTTYTIYDELADLLPLDLPLLTAFPEDLGVYLNNISSTPSQYRRVDFSSLDNATCFVCGNAVEFIGFLDNNKGSISPKFICTECGRTSDGCQTYEGYHEMYEQCPVELGRLGYRLDCGIWKNKSYHRPAGPCPVCEAD